MSFATFSSHWPRFIALLSARAGLLVRDKDRGTVVSALEARRKALGLATPERYLELLETDTHDSEWKHLLPLLTNGESYFLRDTRQFSLLRHTILPELMSQKQGERQLRFWSAGCSTGEEVYSLAILADEVAPRNQGWKASVLGTDINETAIIKARTGLYSQWSFRGVDDETKARYFQKSGNHWKVSERLKALVDFRCLNLRGTDFPDPASDLVDIDLILCRNVLIYLQPDAVAHALRGFTATLRVGGFLLTGHAELAHHTTSLQTRIFPESVAYQKPTFVSQPQSILNAPLVRSVPSKPSPIVSRPTPIPASTPAPRPASAIHSTSLASQRYRQEELQPLALDVSPASRLCEVARREANLGRHAPAIAALQAAVALDPVNAEAYALWAQVASEQGEVEAAKRLWKKVVFLAPSRIDAWLDLGALYAATGDSARARRMRQTALELLEALPEDAPIQPGSNVKAGELATHVAELLEGTIGS